MDTNLSVTLSNRFFKRKEMKSKDCIIFFNLQIGTVVIEFISMLVFLNIKKIHLLLLVIFKMSLISFTLQFIFRKMPLLKPNK